MKIEKMNQMRKIFSRSNFFRNQLICLILAMVSFNSSSYAQNVASNNRLLIINKSARETFVGGLFTESLHTLSKTDTFEAELKSGPYISELGNNKLISVDESRFLASIYFNEVPIPLRVNRLQHEGSLKTMPTALKSFHTGFENLKPSLTWIAAVEDNLNYYAVQRSLDGLEYQEIAFVFPEGIQLVDSKYSFIDHEIPSGTIGVIYYRLRLKDSHGAEEFSGVKTMYLGLGERNKLGGLNFEGSVKELSYPVRTSKRPEIEQEEDRHPWPIPDNRSGVQKIWDDCRKQVTNKVKSIWNSNH